MFHKKSTSFSVLVLALTLGLFSSSCTLNSNTSNNYPSNPTTEAPTKAPVVLNDDVKSPQKFESENLILESPLESSVISSPLKIEGKALGTMFSEGVLNVQLQDSSGTNLGTAQATAIGSWMTTEFVPFEVNMTYSRPQSRTGKLIFVKGNPSGLPANDLKIEVEVLF